MRKEKKERKNGLDSYPVQGDQLPTLFPIKSVSPISPCIRMILSFDSFSPL